MAAMKRLAIIAAVLLALVVTASAIADAVRELAPRPSQAAVTARDTVERYQSPVVRRTAVVGALVAAQRLRGNASWMPAKYGPDYLAMRLPRGTAVRICAATCIDMTVNDYGPSKRIHPDRIADIAVERWERICQLPRSRGVCGVTVGLAVAARPTLPATDR